MPIDLLIVSDEKDDLKRYIDPIEQAFRHVKKSIDVERTSTRYVGKGNISKAKRVLLLLHGSREREEKVCKTWLTYLHIPQTAEKHWLAITITEPANGNPAENTRINDQQVDGQNILVLENIDIVETWVPQLIRKFFIIEEGHKNKIVSVRNMSPEYALATQTERSVRNILNYFGINLDPVDSASVCVVVCRSSLMNDTQRSQGIHNYHDSVVANGLKMYCISTTFNNIEGYQDVYPLRVFGRPNILNCVVMTLCDIGIIYRNDFKRKFSQLFIQMIFWAKTVISCVIVFMHFVYAINLLPAIFIGAGVFTCVHVFRDPYHSWDYFDDYADKITNLTLTTFWLGLVWGVNLGGGPTPNAVITLVVVAFFIIWYTIAHFYMFKEYLGYKYGVFDIPWVWWNGY